MCVIATPSGAEWFDLEQVEQVTGHQVRLGFRPPAAKEFRPRGDAVLVAPATFNTINKWALGINDTLALGLLNEALGASIPTTVQPMVNSSLAGHPQFQASVDRLQEGGVEFIYEY